MPEASDTLDRVMVVGAHPDDPEFGCAGTVATWAQAGKSITYVLLTSGDKGSREPQPRPGELAAMREKEQRAAAKDLGVERVIFRRHPDGLLENNMALRREIAGIIREHKPHILMTMDPWRRYQLHPDHRAAGEAALDAIYAAREWHTFPEQLADGDGPWRVVEVYLFWTDSPDHWEDITPGIEQRISALARHATQVKSRQSELGERIREGTRQVGEQAGYEYAEAFKRIQIERRRPKATTPSPAAKPPSTT